MCPGGQRGCSEARSMPARKTLPWWSREKEEHLHGGGDVCVSAGGVCVAARNSTAFCTDLCSQVCVMCVCICMAQENSPETKNLLDVASFIIFSGLRLH